MTKEEHAEMRERSAELTSDYLVDLAFPPSRLRLWLRGRWRKARNMLQGRPWFGKEEVEAYCAALVNELK